MEAVDGIVVEAELDAGDASDRPIPYIRAHVHTHISMHARTLIVATRSNCEEKISEILKEISV